MLVLSQDVVCYLAASSCFESRKTVNEVTTSSLKHRVVQIKTVAVKFYETCELLAPIMIFVQPMADQAVSTMKLRNRIEITSISTSCSWYAFALLQEMFILSVQSVQPVFMDVM